MTKPLFISYRRVDNAHALLLRDKLRAAYGDDNLFFDTSRNDGIPLAADFRAAIDQALQTMECLLVLIGPGWTSEVSLARLHQAEDVVRHEITTALTRKSSGETIAVLPVLCGKTLLPSAEHLPDDLKQLTNQNAIYLSPDPERYENDVEDIRAVIDENCLGLRARLCNDWLRRVLADAKRSKSLLGQNIAVKDPASAVVRRRAALQALEGWWGTWPQRHDAFVLHGHEGDGKSWAVADWLAEKLERPCFPVPLVYVPTQKLDTSSLLDIGAFGLARVHGNAPEHHKKTLSQQFERSRKDAPIALLVVDALNERPSLSWSSFFDDLRVTSIRERIAVIVLCRTGYWRSLDVPSDGLVAQWSLAPYDDRELDELLQLRRSSLREIQANYTADVLTLLHRPRYFDLAFRLKDEAGQGGLTLERLIYEDWRDQTSRKMRMPLDHEGFLALLQGLASDYERRRFPLHKFGEHARNLGADVAELRHELASSGIIDSSGGRVRLGERHLALALGLVLAGEVEEALDYEQMTEVVAQRLAESGEADLQVRICAMALFHALVTDDFPDEGRFALLRAWVEGRNLNADDLRRIPAYLPLRPRVYLRLAEVLWGELDNREAQDHFMVGLLRHRERENVRDHLLPRFTRWLSFVHSCGQRAYWGGEEPEMAKGRATVTERLGQTPVPGTLRVLDVELNIIDDSRPGLLRLAQVALAVMSHQSDSQRADVDALATGVVAAAVMKTGHANYDWLLQIAPASVRESLCRRACVWLQMPGPLAPHAASYLLHALDSEEANHIIETLPIAHTRRRESFLIRWDESDFEFGLDHCADSSPTQIAANLQKVALNPNIVLKSETVERVRDAGRELDLNQVSRCLGQTSEDHTLEQIEPAICAFAAPRYRDLSCQLAATVANRSGKSLQAMSARLLKHIPMLGEAERSIVGDTWRTCVQRLQPSEVRISPEQATELFLFPAVLFELDDHQQVLRLLERNGAHGWWTGHKPAFCATSRPEALAALERLGQSPIDQPTLRRLLEFFVETLDGPAYELREWLVAQFAEFDSTTRGLCLQLFHQTADETGAEWLMTSGWRVCESQSYWENLWGSLLLGKLGQRLSFADLVKRIAPEQLGYAVGCRGGLDIEVAEYAQVLDDILSRICAEGSPSRAELNSLATCAQVEVDFSANVARDSLGSSDRGNLSRRFTNSAWGGTAGNSSVEDWVRPTDPEKLTDESNQLSRRIGEFQESQRAAGNPFFACSFQHGELKRVVSARGSPWRKWIEPVVANVPDGVSLLGSCRGFFEKLCAALLSHSPADGVLLFKAISHHTGLRITESRLELPVLLLDTFSAPPTPELDDLTNGLLLGLVESANNDHELFQYALLAQLGGRGDWLRRLCKRWLASDWELNQARALVLLGFSGHTDDARLLGEWIGSNGDSWLKALGKVAEDRSRRHDWARTWFHRFLEHEDRVESWAAFRLFLSCADRRIWLWMDDSGLRQAARWKQEALQFNLGTVMSACRKGERGWRDSFLNHKVKPDEYWPWMKRYLETPH